MNNEELLVERLQSETLRAIIFDFDGTLLDIRQILINSIEEVLQNKNVDIDMDTTIQEIGALLETIQGYPLPKVLLESYEIFNHITALQHLTYFKKLRIAVEIFSKYLEYSKKASFFPPVKPLLKRLSKKFDLFIVSHNKTETIREHLKKNSLDLFFKGVYGSDKIPVQKPYPLALQPPFETYDHQRKREEFVMIGDMPSDIIAGNDAGFWTIGVASGVSKKEILAEFRPNLLLESLEDLLKIIEK
ncbi:MAG: HAD family hydrolase [Promethearchaeota archaeon]|jgi:HAD superfamily hydrolase (TIGR01549 family)